MAGLIIYKGKYGATAQYANWLADELNIPVYQASSENEEILNHCEYVVLGTSVYIGKLQLANWIRQHEEILIKKRVFLFVVCGTSPDQTAKLNDIVDQNISPGLIKQMDRFFLRGRMIKKNLSYFDRFVLKMGASLQKDPLEKKKMLADFDEVKKINLNKLTERLKEYVAGRTLLKHIC